MKRMLEMTYKMPDPKLGVSRPYIGISESKNAYTADQMQAAYAAGREAMRQECVKVLDAELEQNFRMFGEDYD